jgi:hypothetical protein
MAEVAAGSAFSDGRFKAFLNMDFRTAGMDMGSESSKAGC